MGKKSKRRPGTLRIKRNGAGLSPEQDAIIWLKKEKELVTPEGSLRRADTINTEVSVYYNLAKAHFNNPAGRNDSRAEFYYQKVIDFENRDMIEMSALGVSESFAELFVWYVKSGRTTEASSLLHKCLSKWCSRGLLHRHDDADDSAETYFVLLCIHTIFQFNASFTFIGPFVPVFERHIQVLEKISGSAIQALYNELNNYFLTVQIYSKALTYAKKRLHAIQKSALTRYGKLEFEALIKLAESFSFLGMCNDAISQLETGEKILIQNEGQMEIRDKDSICGEREKMALYEAFGVTLKDQAQVAMTKDEKKGLNEKSISYFKKAIKIRYYLLDQLDRNGGADTADHTIKYLNPAVRTSMQLGRQLANNKKWSSAKKYYMLGIDLAERKIPDPFVLGLACEHLGKVYLDQYFDPDYFESEEAELLLNSAVEYTQKCFASNKQFPLPKVMGIHALPISFDIAIETYFLGNKDEACRNLACHLIALALEQSCTGCSHTYIKGTDAVGKKCSSCNACYYCNDACQQRHWNNIDDKRKRHKLLCPLLKELKGSHVDDIMDRVKFEGPHSARDKIVGYFEGLKPSKSRKKPSREIDSVD